MSRRRRSAFALLFALLIIALRLPAQTVALGRFAHVDHERNDPENISAIVDQLLVRLDAETTYDFVERAALDRLLAENALSQDGLLRADGAARIGRLLAVDLFLSGTFQGLPGQPQAIVLEVVEPARAETVARVRVELEPMLYRGRLAPLSAVNLDRIAAAAPTVLAEGWREVQKRPDQVLMKLLALPNRSGLPAFDDFATRLEQRLAEPSGANSPQRLLHTHRPDVATPENELRLLGLAQADASAWNQVADHYVWGVMEKEATGVKLRVHVWNGRSTPRELVFPVPGEPYSVSALTTQAGEAILAATREPTRRTRAPGADAGQRESLSNLLLKQARLIAGPTIEDPAAKIPAPAQLKEAQRLAAAAIFLDPARYENWAFLGTLRGRETQLYSGNQRLFHTAAVLDYSASLFSRFLVGADGRINEQVIVNPAGGRLSLSDLEFNILNAKDGYANIHQGILLLHLRDRMRADYTTHLENASLALAKAAPGQEDAFRIAAGLVVHQALEAKLEPARINRILEHVWPRLKIVTFVYDAWYPSGERIGWSPSAAGAKSLDERVRDFLLTQSRIAEARAAGILSAEELTQALATPPPPNSPGGEAEKFAKSSREFLNKLKPGTPGYASQLAISNDYQTAKDSWRIRAEAHLRGRSVTPPDPREAMAELLKLPVPSSMTREHPALEAYPPAARANFAAELLAYYATKEASAYPPEVVARLTAQIKSWQGAAVSPSVSTAPAAPEEAPPSSASGTPQAFLLMKNAAKQSSGPTSRPAYLHVREMGSKLGSAATQGDVATLNFLFDRGAPIEASGKAFLEAVNGSRWTVVEYLLGKGYNPGAPWPFETNNSSESASYGARALAAAAKQNRGDLMTRIASFGVRFTPGSEVALNAVTERATAGDAKGLETLLAASALSTADTTSISAPYFAPVIARRDLPMLKALLKAGAKPHQPIPTETITLYITSVAQSENWREELRAFKYINAIESAARLNWREGVEAMLAAPALNQAKAFERWPYVHASDPVLRSRLLGTNLRLLSPGAASAPGIELFQAIAANDAAAVAVVWKNPVARGFRTRFGQGPLAFAITEKHAPIARLLVEQGAVLDDLDQSGVTPLAHAAASGDVELVRYLVAKGANKNLQRGTGHNPLGYAIASRQSAAALALLDLGASISSPPRLPPVDPLFTATALNLPEVVNRLLALGANHKAVIDGMTILFPASRSNNPELIQRFVDLGSDLKARNRDGWTPLVSAVRWGADLSTAKLLDLGLRDPKAADAAVSINQEPKSPYRPTAEELQALSFRPDFRRCLELLQENSQVGGSSPAQERIFWTGFTRKSKAEVAEHLKNGGNVNFPDGPMTPLQVAAVNANTYNGLPLDKNGHLVRTERSEAGLEDPMLSWVEFLLKNGANPETTGKEEPQTAIVLGRCNPAVVRLLLANKARIDKPTNYSDATGYGKSSLLDLTISDPNTPPATVRLLLDHGAKIVASTRLVFANLRKSQPQRIPQLEAVLTPDELRQLRGAP